MHNPGFAFSWSYAVCNVEPESGGFRCMLYRTVCVVLVRKHDVQEMLCAGGCM